MRRSSEERPDIIKSKSIDNVRMLTSNKDSDNDINKLVVSECDRDDLFSDSSLEKGKEKPLIPKKLIKLLSKNNPDFETLSREFNLTIVQLKCIRNKYCVVESRIDTGRVKKRNAAKKPATAISVGRERDRATESFRSAYEQELGNLNFPTAPRTKEPGIQEQRRKLELQQQTEETIRNLLLEEQIAMAEKQKTPESMDTTTDSRPQSRAGQILSPVPWVSKGKKQAEKEEKEKQEKEERRKRAEKEARETAEKEEQASASREGFTFPRKQTKLKELLQPPPPKLTSNRFEALTHTETETDILEKSVEAGPSASRRTTPPARRSPPKRSVEHCPPIVLNMVPTQTDNSHKELVAEIKRHIKKGFFLRYARRSTLIYIKDQTEFEMYKKKLISMSKTEDAVQFHTYTSQAQKTHAFVIRGLHGAANLEELQQELQDEYTVDVRNIFKMRTKQTPLYLLVTGPKETLADLKHRVKYLNYTKISFERRINTNLITQCRRCQGWGHATANCYREPKCLKCGEDHLTSGCPYPREHPPKCANCDGPHISNNKSCPVYQFRIKQLGTNPENPQELVPAPQPSTNVWDERTRAAAASRSRTQQYQHDPVQETATARRQPPRATQTTPGQPYLPDADEGLQDDAQLLKEIVAETGKISTYINLFETLKALKKLNEMLSKATTPIDAVFALQEYTTNILPQYRVLRE